MTGFIVATSIVGTLVLLVYLMDLALEGSRAHGAALVAVLIAALTVMLNATKPDEAGPCHQYETKMMFNPATKTMMPSRACVLRGEWVDEEE